MDIKQKVSEYVTGLLGVLPETVIIGRENFDRFYFGADFIIVDALALGVPVGRAQSFDGDTEKETYNARFEGTFTIDFYGDTASQNAYSFIVLQASQANFELCRDIGLTINYVSNLTDLRTVEGSQQNNRVQAELKVGYEEQVIVDTLRIDEAQLEFLNDK